MAELERLKRELEPKVKLVLESDGPEVIVSAEDSDSYLRFRPIGLEVILTEVFVCNDERAQFLHQVLGPLMLQHGGDLHLRLTWNIPERNGDRDWAELKINRGVTTYPELAPKQPPPNEVEVVGLSGREDEIIELLDKARAYWAEYQRLKAKRGR